MESLVNDLIKKQEEHIDNLKYVPSLFSNSVLNAYLIQDIKYAKKNRQGIALTDAVSEYYNAPLLGIGSIITILGYSELQLVKKLLPIFNKRLEIVLVGAGGVNQNIIYWLIKLIEYFGLSDNVRYNITVYDDDELSIDNLYRFPFSHKLISNYNSKRATLNKVILNKLPNCGVVTIEEKITESNLHKLHDKVVIGATDGVTRKLLGDDSKINYYQVTTQGNKYSIIQNPKYKFIVPDLYDTINLPLYHLSLLDLTINLLFKLSYNKFDNNEYIVINRNIKEYLYKNKKYLNILLDIDIINFFNVPDKNINYVPNNGFIYTEEI